MVNDYPAPVIEHADERFLRHAEPIVDRYRDLLPKLIPIRFRILTLVVSDILMHRLPVMMPWAGHEIIMSTVRRPHREPLYF